MEPSYQTRKIIGRWLALVTLALVAGGFWAYYTSPLVRNLTSHTKDSTLSIAIFTQPAMLFTYYPTTHKVQITVASQKCAWEQQEYCFAKTFDRFFIPKETVQNIYWSRFKENLSQWRFTPWVICTYVHAYINALVQHKTNIRPSEFILLSKEIIELTSNDFAIAYTTSAKKSKNSAKATPQAAQNLPLEKPGIVLPTTQAAQQPLVVEILNASGKKGLALAVTQYLREQNAKGLLRIDVLQYDNYPSLQDKSFVIDYSGKLVQVTQTSRALGIRGEIHSEKSTTAICDTRIILGKDFKMPL